MMNRLSITLCMLMFAMSIFAQDNKKFSPEKFDAELQEFITREANLTPAEAEKFFPVYKEMQNKQRVIFDKIKNLNRQRPQDERGYQKAIKESDQNDLEMKRIQQTYHERFMELLPASKVYDILQAEYKFHRRMLRGWNHGNGGPRNRPMPQNQRPQR